MQLAQEAVWYGDRCNWLGAKPRDNRLGYAQPAVYGALGPELYSGTAGVALFLAELYAALGETGARRAALGAIRQAVSRVDDVAPTVMPGLHTGWSGIALAAALRGTLRG